MRPETREAMDEWVRELERAQHATGNDDGLTTKEFAAECGQSIRWVYERLQALDEEGRVRVGFRIGKRIDKQRKRTVVYQILPAEKTKCATTTPSASPRRPRSTARRNARRRLS